mgnify:CR=1 FL=1
MCGACRATPATVDRSHDVRDGRVGRHSRSTPDRPSRSHRAPRSWAPGLARGAPAARPARSLDTFPAPIAQLRETSRASPLRQAARRCPWPNADSTAHAIADRHQEGEELHFRMGGQAIDAIVVVLSRARWRSHFPLAYLPGRVLLRIDPHELTRDTIFAGVEGHSVVLVDDGLPIPRSLSPPRHGRSAAAAHGASSSPRRWSAAAVARLAGPGVVDEIVEGPKAGLDSRGTHSREEPLGEVQAPAPRRGEPARRAGLGARAPRRAARFRRQPDGRAIGPLPDVTLRAPTARPATAGGTPRAWARRIQRPCMTPNASARTINRARRRA